MNIENSQSDLLRLVGVMAVCVGVAWVLQILGVSADGSAVARLMWIIGAASIAGAGVGAIYASSSLRAREETVRI